MSSHTHFTRVLILASAFSLAASLGGCDQGPPASAAKPAAGGGHSHDHDHDHAGHDHDHDHAGHDHGHDHPEIPKVADYTQLVTQIRRHAELIDKKLADGSLEGLHNDAYVVTELAAIAGKLALEDTGVSREKIRDANEAGKALAKAADDLHLAADAGKLDDSRRLFASMQPLINRIAAAAPDQWVCDMHCEPGKVYESAGKCPVCKMNLTRKQDIPYSAIITALSPTLEPGKPVELKIDLRDRVGLPVEKLDTVHEYPLHLLTVSNDLSWYSHEHPVRQPDGSFKVTLTFPHGGDYTVFSDFTPTGEVQQVPSAPLALAGTPPTAVPLVEDVSEVRKVDGYEFRVRCNGGAAFVGRDSLIRYGVMLDGRPVTDLEPYLGALGHLVIISQDLQSFVHSHPLNDAGKHDGHDHAGHDHDHDDAHAGHDHGGRSVADLLAEAEKYGNGLPTDPIFHVVFPKPGLYKSFAQFKHKGRTLTVPFTFDVKPEDGSAPLLAPGKGTHDHSDHGGKH